INYGWNRYYAIYLPTLSNLPKKEKSASLSKPTISTKILFVLPSLTRGSASVKRINRSYSRPFNKQMDQPEESSAELALVYPSVEKLSSYWAGISLWKASLVKAAHSSSTYRCKLQYPNLKIGYCQNSK